MPSLKRAPAGALFFVLVLPGFATEPPRQVIERRSPPDRSASLGPDGAALTVVVFFDYQCPVCPRAAAEFERLVADFGGDVRLSLHHTPLAMHPRAMEAAVAAEAARRQGRFWEFHEKLLMLKGALDSTAFERVAVGIGIDLERFRLDRDHPSIRQPIVADLQAAETLGGGGTPGFLLNGRMEVRRLIATGMTAAEASRRRIETTNPTAAPVILDLLAR